MIEDLWYKNTVIYSLDLETFMDANGDGVGDFDGLMRRLDYLHWLGVGAVWLAPFHPTPNRDNGYDISDFYGVDPRHGSSGDFVEFIHHANKRGIKVLMDLVVNHTSDEHPWFQAARKDKDSPYRDWYVWSKKRPPDWKEGVVFPGVQHATWTRDEKANAYYYHRFYEFQPDLNMDNPAVRIEIRRIMGYWLQLGVAGFRVDAVPFLIENAAPGEEQGVQRFDYLREMRQFLQWRVGNAILLGEANVLPKENRKYFGGNGGDGIHMMFNFFVNQHLFYALATAEVRPLIQAIRATQNIPSTAQWAQFLRNHDELDLGRLTEEQREKVFARFGPEERMQLYHRGIRRRLASMLGDRRHIELAYSAMFSLPGTPVIRYGDELGMGDDLQLKERESVRTPMQWADERQGGFSTAEKTVHPLVDHGVWDYRHVNVEGQRRNPSSLLNWTARMIRLRKECPEIGWGSYRILNTGQPCVLALRYDWRGNSVLVVHNFDEKPHEARIDPQVEMGGILANLIEEEESHADDDGKHRIPLEAYGYRWYRVGGLNYAIYREKA
ncbi:MAG: alpha-amylase family protein [Desulforhabdus sp.]|jgi:maltose alpha-D-glucosyltransferase/alpha-amylase|nr:alpha-amylase family protein [Desulforhabdus sp.]